MGVAYREGVRRPAVGLGVVGKRYVVKRILGNQRTDRLRRRGNVVRRFRTVDGVGDRHIPQANVRIGKRAGRGHAHFTVQNVAGLTNMDRRNVSAVVRLIIDRRPGHGNLALGNFDLRRTGPVVVISALDFDVGGIGTRVGVGRKVGGIGFTVGRVENGVGRFGAGDRNAVRPPVVNGRNSINSNAGYGGVGNIRGRRPGNRSNIVPRIGAGDGVTHIDGDPVGNIRIGELAGRRYTDVVAGNEIRQRSGGDVGGCRPVVDLVGSSRVANRQLERADRQNRTARPVGVIRTLNFRVNLVGSCINELRKLSRVGLGIKRIENFVAGRCAADNNPMFAAIVGRGTIVEGHSKLGRSDHHIRAARPVAVIVTFDLDVDRVGPDVGKFRLFGGVSLGVERVKNRVAVIGTTDGDRMIGAVIDPVVSRQGYRKRRRRNRTAEGLCAEFKHVIRARRAVERVGYRHGFVRTDVGIAKLAGSSHGNPPEIGIGNARKRNAGHFGNTRAVVNAVGHFRAGHRYLTRSDFKRRLFVPFGVIRTPDFDRNGISPDVLELRHLGVSLTAIGVGNDVAPLRPRKEKTVLGAVVNYDASRERVGAGCVVDHAVHRFIGRGDIVRRVGAGDGIGHIHVPLANIGEGELAAGRHEDFVTGDQVPQITSNDRRGFRAVVNLALNRCAGNRQLERIDNQGRAPRPVGVIVALNFRVNLVGPRIDKLRKIRAVILGIKRVEDPVAVFGTADDNPMFVAIVGRGTIVEGHRKLGRRDQGADRLRRRDDIVPDAVARKGVLDRHVPQANVRIGKRAGCSHGHFIVQYVAGLTNMNGRNGRRVVNLVLDRRPVNRNLTRSDFKCRFTRPVGVIRTLNLRVNLVGSRIDKLRKFRRVGLGVKRIEDNIAVFEIVLVDGNRMFSAVISHGITVEANGERRRSDARLDCPCSRGKVVTRLPARDGVANRNVVGAGIGRGELAAGRHEDFVTCDQVPQITGNNRRGFRAVVNLALNRRAGNRQLERVDDQGRATRPVGVIRTLNFRVNLVGSCINELRKLSRVGLGIKRIENFVAGRCAADNNPMFAAIVGRGTIVEGHRELGRSDQSADRLRRRDDVIPVFVPRKGVLDRHVPQANVRIGKCAGCSHGHFIVQYVAGLTEMNRRFSCRIVNLVLDRRPVNRNLTRVDHGTGRTGGIIVVNQIVAVNDVFHVDGVLARIGAFER